ncbi:MAG: enoyl-CoA hydratase-related protein, partial [Rhodospirillaceae bacterium]|nr:enoyl-CoA hydratase-related protein [Rhodospirillaceae bacterium]
MNDVAATSRAGQGSGSDPDPNSDRGRIATERRGGLFLIGIDRPAKYNGFTPEMCVGLAEAYSEYEADGDLRCAVVHAAGAHFTAGLELSAFDITEPAFFPPDLVDPFDLRPPFRTKPVVAAVKGICFTLGIELMLAADVAVAEEGTRFSQLEVKRGLMAFGGATIRFVERAGWGDAMRWLLTGDEFDA